LEPWVGPVNTAAGPLSLRSKGPRWGPIISNELLGGRRGYAFWAVRLSTNRWGDIGLSQECRAEQGAAIKSVWGREGVSTAISAPGCACFIDH